MTENILVTGGAGYIGSHACKAMAAAGYTPVTLDNLVYGHQAAVKWGPLEIGDIADTKFVRTILEEYSIAAVMHFAAYAYVGESVQNPQKYYMNNVAGALSLLEAMIDCSVNKFIFSSTCATYGEPLEIPITEDHPQRPINPYGKSKVMVEQILEDYSSAYGMKAISLRYFNAAGADPDLEIGEDHTPETHLIPLIIRAAMDDTEPIIVFGTDYPTKDGTCVRDYIHVCDLADAHCLALKTIMDGQSGSKFNLGNGSGYTVHEVIDIVEKISQKSVNVKYGMRRSGDPVKLVGSSDKARCELGWRPRFASLETIIDTALNWHFNNPQGFNE